MRSFGKSTKTIKRGFSANVPYSAIFFSTKASNMSEARFVKKMYPFMQFKRRREKQNASVCVNVIEFALSCIRHQFFRCTYTSARLLVGRLLCGECNTQANKLHDPIEYVILKREF